MRRAVKVIPVAALLALALTLAACGDDDDSKASAGTGGGGGVPAANAVVNGQLTGISVTGVGEVTTTPDVVVLQLGVATSSEKLTDAQKEATAKMNAVMDALKAQGIADKDITTVRYSVFQESPEPRPLPPGTPERMLFHVENIVMAKLRDVSKAGAVVDAAIAAGANRFESISFTVDDQSSFQAQAREKAMTDAKAKAEALAKHAGVKVGKPVLISDTTSGPVTPKAAPEAVGFGGGGTPISGGEMVIQVTLQVVYEID